GRRPALPHLRRPRRPDEARHGGSPRRRGRHRRGARRPLRRLRPGGVEAPEGAGRRRAGEPEQGRTTSAVPPRSGGLRPDDQVDRAVPPTGPGALRAPGRRPRRAAGRPHEHQPTKPTTRSSVM
ncbi:MAG: Transcriptional regulator, ArsR family, partial [uncultured Acidimicrobiales bacterium]